MAFLALELHLEVFHQGKLLLETIFVDPWHYRQKFNVSPLFFLSHFCKNYRKFTILTLVLKIFVLFAIILLLLHV